MSYLIDENSLIQIDTSNTMSYHTILRTSSDYTEALKFARTIADNLTAILDIEDVEIFPYSVFYVFYEQYLTIWSDAIASLSYSLLLIFLVSFIFSNFNLFSALIILLIVLMILMNMFALMYFWNITLNAVSLVNLVMVIICIIFIVLLLYINCFIVL